MLGPDKIYTSLVLTLPTSTYCGVIKRLRRTNNWDVETYRIKLQKGFGSVILRHDIFATLTSASLNSV